MRLIDADALAQSHIECPPYLSFSAFGEMVEMFIKLIDAQPTVDIDNAEKEALKAEALTESQVLDWIHQHGAVVVGYDIYEMLKACYGREPKRGKWIDTVTAGIEETVCSNCRCSGFHHMNYCPRCGAIMEA